MGMEPWLIAVIVAAVVLIVVAVLVVRWMRRRRVGTVLTVRSNGTLARSRR